METKHMRLVVEVVRSGSVRGAAAAAHVSPQVVSDALRAVEAELGAALFVRSPRGMEPTDAGRVFVAEAQAAIDAAAGVGEAVRRRLAGGTVRLAVAPGTGDVASALVRALADATGADAGRDASAGPVPVELVDLAGVAQPAALRRHAVDAGIALLPVAEADRATVHSTPILSTPTRALLRADDELAGCGPVSLADLVGRPLLLPPAGQVPPLTDGALAAFARAGLSPRLGPPVPRHELVAAMVDATGGYTLCVRGTAPVPATTVFVDVVEPVDPHVVGLLWPAGGVGPAVDRAVRTARALAAAPAR